MSTKQNRREFFADVGRGMLVASVGYSVASDLGLTPALAEETAEAREIIGVAGTPTEGLADLRWALLNCHEFRYLP